MIAFLSGTIKYIADDYIILEVNNVGYRVFLSPLAFSSLAKVGDKAEFFIHTHVREDVFNLYGFATFAELDFFETIIGVAGVGPKAGLGVLSAASVPEIKQAIASEDTSLFTRVPGVGKKTAERIILELKGKVEATPSQKRAHQDRDHNFEDALSGLVKLGVQARDAERLLGETPADIKTAGDKIKWVLRNLGR